MNPGVNGTSLVNHTEIFWHEIESTDVVVWLFPWGDVLRAYSAGGSLWPACFQPQFALGEVVVGKALGQTTAEAVRNAPMAEEGNDAITSTTGRKP